MDTRPTAPPCPATTQAILRQLADSPRMLVWMADANDVCIYLNRNAPALFAQELKIDIFEWLQFMHPDDSARVAPILRDARNERKEYQVEYRIIRSDGSIRWMMGSAAPRFSESGEFLGYNGTIVDVSDRHQALERLAKSEAGYRLLAESGSDLISHYTPDETFIYASPSYQRVLGFEPSELIGSCVFDYLHPDDILFVQQEVQRQLNGDSESGLIELRKRHKDGHYIWMGTKARVLLDPVTNERIGTVAVSRDITFERLAKEELRRREERFRSLTNLSTDWYWETDADGRFTFVSEGVQRLWTITAEQLLGKTRIDLAANRNDPGLQEYCARLGKREAFKDIRYAAGTPSMKTGYVSISGEPVFEQGVFNGYRGVGRDVTREIEAARNLAQLAAENKALVGNSLDIMALLDQEGRFLQLNDAVVEILGFRPEELLGRHYAAFLHPDELEKTSALDAGLRTGSGTIQDFENRWIRKDGSTVHLSLSVRLSDDKKLMYATARDMTERYHTQVALQLSKDRLNAVLESVGDAFFAMDRHWRVTYANRKAVRFVGLTADDFKGRLLWEAVPGIRESPVFRHYQNAMESRENTFFEAYYEPARAWVEVRAYPYEDGLSVFFHDVTARHEAESVIRHSEQRFREVIEMTPAGYVLADEQAKVAEVNPALCRMSGYTRDELIGQGVSQLFPAYWNNTLFNQSDATVHGRETVIKHKNGDLVYVLLNANIRRDSQGTGLGFTGFLTDITERKQVEARLEQLATRDTLTGLPNRAYLHERLEQTLNSLYPDKSIAVMFIDLDRFKEVNDSFGHEPGDMLLCEVGQRLKKSLRPTDMVARLGGDEFVVVANCSNGPASAATIAEELLSALAASVEIAGQEIFVGASIGISMFPENGKSKELLFQNADTAMYRAKAKGRNSYCFFEPEMTLEAKTRITLENSLRRALERNEFELHYQPRIRLKTMSIVGMEALIRWNHPQLGQVPPMQFIPIAEERGLIDPIGRWVLEEACMQTRRLMGKFGRPLRVSVNLSARQLKCHSILKQVQAALEKARLPPHLLELELTESALIEDIEATSKMLKELKKLGILLSVDDFGTGYSGLAYLRRFPLDTLKLDRSFVTQQDDGISNFKFIKAFVDLARTLNLSVLAEGVETSETLQLIRDAACDEAQGFFLAKPMPLDEFETFLSRLPRSGNSTLADGLS
jgi:diguanylate cyclase (GGDEF)-like protein/PAS domain S-box-containing protein